MKINDIKDVNLDENIKKGLESLHEAYVNKQTNLLLQKNIFLQNKIESCISEIEKQFEEIKDSPISKNIKDLLNYYHEICKLRDELNKLRGEKNV